MSMEQTAGIIIFSVLGIPGIIFGIVLICGKGADLIAGYNSLPSKEREKWNEQTLCRAVGILLLIMVGCIELIGVGAILDIMILEWTGCALLIIFTAGGLVYINKSKRFKNGGMLH